MKILYVLNSGVLGGMEWHVYFLAKGMIEKGHEVFVWCNKGPLVEEFKKIRANVNIKRIKLEGDPQYILCLRKFLIENKIDIIHAHEVKAVANASVAKKLAGTKVLVTHTHTPISEWGYSKLQLLVDVKFNNFFVNYFSDAEIALTESRKRVKINEGIRPEKLVVIPNGINLQKFDVTITDKESHREEIRQRYNIPQNAFVFGVVGRLTEEKGIPLLIRAFNKFLESDLFHQRDFYLLIAGGGQLESELRDMTNDLGIKEKVIITGRFDEEEKPKIYSSLDAFIFPSLREGFGIVLIEAMYNSLPIICSDLEVLREVGCDTVEFFRVGDDQDLSEKMVNLYQEVASDGKVMGERSRERVENNYTIEKFISNYQNLYTKLMEKHR